MRAKRPIATQLAGIAGVALLGVAPPQAAAGGFYTAPANPVYNLGPESAWMNPAGMTGVETTSVTIGVGGAIPIAEFDVSLAGAGGDDGGNAGVNAFFPTAFAVKPIDRLRLGVSILSPSGAVTGTGVDYGERFVGRYAATDAKLSSIMFAPALAYQVNDSLSLGIGGGALYTVFDQSIAVNTPGADGKAYIDDLDGWAGMFFAGLTFKLGPATTFGAVYRSRAEVDISGRIAFSNLPVQPPDVQVDVEWDNPQTLQLGLSHALNPEWILTADVWWEDWSVFSNNRFEVEFVNNTTNVKILDRNFKDVYGGGLALTRIAGPNILSFGFSYESSPVKDGDRTADLPLDSILALSVGFAHNASKSRTYGIGGTLLFNGDGRLDQTAQGVRFAGEFDTNVVFVLGGSVQWRF
jgi:long-chain fatty acid transport protein